VCVRGNYDTACKILTHASFAVLAYYYEDQYTLIEFKRPDHTIQWFMASPPW